MRLRSPLACLAGLLLTACATAPIDRSAVAHDREALLEADIAFDAVTAARGLDGWISCFEPETTQWSHADLVHGREKYRETMGKLFSTQGLSLRWQPAWAEADRDLGYTTGKWQLHALNDGRDTVTATGHYVTVWRRQSDGSWKVAFDLGNDDK